MKECWYQCPNKLYIYENGTHEVCVTCHLKNVKPQGELDLDKLIEEANNGKGN